MNTGEWPIEFYDIYLELKTKESFSVDTTSQLFMHLVMKIGLVIIMITHQLALTLFTLVLIRLDGRPRHRSQWQDLRLRHNIGL